MIVRPLRTPDAPAVAALIGAAFAELAARLDPPPSALGETEETVRAHLAAGGGGAGALGPGLVGVVLWQEQEGGLYVRRLAVLPERRRQGIARALITAAERVALERALPRLHLGTRLALASNRALFTACGFMEVSRHAHPGHTAPTWIALEKRLLP